MNLILAGAIAKGVGELLLTVSGILMMQDTAKKVTQNMIGNWIDKTDKEAERLAKEKEEKG